MKYILFLAIIICGCSLQEDFPYQSDKKIVAVNSILHPDSLILVRVNYTAAYPSGKEGDVIQNAQVNLYEENSLIGTLSYNSEKKAYTLDYLPKENLSYQITVNIAGEQSLEASTHIPPNSTSEACYEPFPSGLDIKFNDKIFVQTQIKKTDSKSSIYLSLMARHFLTTQTDTFPYQEVDSSRTELRFATMLYSNSAYVDRFNGQVDEGLNLYSYYLRLDQASGQSEYSIDAYSFDTYRMFRAEQMRNLSGSLGLYVNVYTVSEEYDRYMKSSLLYLLNSNPAGDIPNPFAEQIVNYSNVSGGTGVFAGYNSQTIKAHLSKCD